MVVSLRAAGVAALAFAGEALANKYSLDDVYNQANFYDKFDFITFDDPNQSYVDYLNRTAASEEHLIGESEHGVYLGTDSTKTVLPGSRGRPSVRLESKARYRHGLIIARFDHLPGIACGSWPAFWTLGDGQWPNGGEIDIYEGWNENPTNKPAIHTGPDEIYGTCVLDLNGSNQTGPVRSIYCDNSINRPEANPPQYQFQGCTAEDLDGPWASNLGGTYAMEWTSDFIKLYTWRQGFAPDNINDGGAEIDTSTWGTPLVNLELCDIDSHFAPQRLILNIAFCGNPVGRDDFWSMTCKAKTGVDTCVAYVANNPDAFQESYYDVRDIRYFKAKETTSTSTSSTSTSTSSSSSSSSSSTLTATTTSSSSTSTSESSTSSSSTSASESSTPSESSTSVSSTSSESGASVSSTSSESSTSVSSTASESSTSVSSTSSESGASVSSTASESGGSVSSTSSESSTSVSSTASESGASVSSASSESSTSTSSTSSESGTSVSSTLSKSSISSALTSVAPAHMSTSSTSEVLSSAGSSTHNRTLSSRTTSTAPSSQKNGTWYGSTTKPASMTTATVYTTTVKTITSCPPEVTDCPDGHYVTTVTVPLYTTVCDVDALETSAVMRPDSTDKQHGGNGQNGPGKKPQTLGPQADDTCDPLATDTVTAFVERTLTVVPASTVAEASCVGCAAISTSGAAVSNKTGAAQLYGTIGSLLQTKLAELQVERSDGARQASVGLSTLVVAIVAMCI